MATATESAPTGIVAAQPEGANPLQRSTQDHRIARVPDARLFALSVSEEVTGRQAMVALQRRNGDVVSVSGISIRDAIRKFARTGLLVEPASAVSYAGYVRALDNDLIGAGDTVVLLATSSGMKWPRELEEIFPGTPVTDPHELKTVLDNLSYP